MLSDECEHSKYVFDDVVLWQDFPEVEVTSLKHCNFVCLNIFVVYYGLNKIKLAFDVWYKIDIHTFLTYLLPSLGLKVHQPWPWP